MTSARLTISTASDRWRALRFNSRLSGGAKTTLPKLMPTNIQHTHNESLTYCTRASGKHIPIGSYGGQDCLLPDYLPHVFFSVCQTQYCLCQHVSIGISTARIASTLSNAVPDAMPQPMLPIGLASHWAGGFSDLASGPPRSRNASARTLRCS